MRITLVTQKAECAVAAARLSRMLVRETRGWVGWSTMARMV